MAAPNIENFNMQVLRAVAFLYEKHPAVVTIEHSMVSGSRFHKDGSADIEIEDGNESGTIIWLHRDGLVDGDLVKSESINNTPSAGIMNAQLSPRAFRILQATDSNIGGILGEAAVAGLSGPRASVIADRVVAKLIA